jgi:hypothetical protein
MSFGRGHTARVAGIRFWRALTQPHDTTCRLDRRQTSRDAAELYVFDR